MVDIGTVESVSVMLELEALSSLLHTERKTVFQNHKKHVPGVLNSLVLLIEYADLWLH